MVLRSWEKPSKDEPAGTFRFREHALLWGAALEVASRGSDLGVGPGGQSYLGGLLWPHDIPDSFWVFGSDL